MDPSDPVQNTIAQLEQARGIALADAKSYVQIVPGVLPIIGAGSSVELKRWGAGFLAETFATPQLSRNEKETLCLKVLPILSHYLESESEDMIVVKEAVQAAASVYQLVLKHTIFNPSDSTNWQLMSAIKTHVLGRMDEAPAAVRICCVKFIQKVVQAQTQGPVDSRKLEANEASIGLVPSDHPILQRDNLEAEASGLLDRMLGILQENSSDALLVTATLNCLGTLIRTRPTIANKIINTVLYFNPLKLSNSPMTPASRVKIKSMERTTRALLVSVIKKNTSHPLAGRIHEYLEHMRRSRADILDVSRKRAAPVDIDAVADAKRQRVGPEGAAQSLSQIQPLPQFPPLPPGPVSIAQLFTLTDDPGAKNFNVTAIPHDTVARIVLALLPTISQHDLEIRANAVRERYVSLVQQQAASGGTVMPAAVHPADGEDDDDDYEPTLPTEDAEQIANKLDSIPPPAGIFQEGLFPSVQLGPYRLPEPEPLSQEDAVQVGRQVVDRLFTTLRMAEVKPKGTVSSVGFNRLAATGQDRDSLVTLICRIATRATGTESDDDGVNVVKKEYSPDSKSLGDAPIPSYIREQMNLFVVEDFRHRIDCAIAWLTEEWYNDTVSEQEHRANHDSTKSNGLGNGNKGSPGVKTHYKKWTLKFMDEIFHYLDRNDRKLLIRFLAEIPQLDRDMLGRVQALTKDPERVAMTIQALQYLILFKPPVRELCLDILEDLWRNNEDAKALTVKILTKHRPHVVGGGGMNGTAPATVKAES